MKDERRFLIDLDIYDGFGGCVYTKRDTASPRKPDKLKNGEIDVIHTSAPTATPNLVQKFSRRIYIHTWGGRTGTN